MVICMIAADDTRHRLGERTVEIRLAVIREQAVHLHDLMRDNNICRRAAYIFVGISGSGKAALVVECRLHYKPCADLVSAPPFFTYLNYLSAKFMTDYDGIFRHIVGNALMRRALTSRLVGGHADAVRKNMCENLVVLYLRELKFLEAQISHSVKSYRFGFHKKFLSRVRFGGFISFCFFSDFA